MIKLKSKKFHILGHKQLEMLHNLLLNNTEDSEVVKLSLDLNLTESEVILDTKNQCIKFPDGNIVTIPESFDPENSVCYVIRENGIYPVSFFNEETNFYYHLVPTSFRPILRVSATQMHKRPFLEYLERRKVKGVVLDAGTGLGYSAVIVSKTAEKVITVEWDYNVIEIASHNPHSALIFDSENVELYNEDITEFIKQFDENYFDNIIQDGGTPKSSGSFFSQNHANELFRILKPRGQVFFYLPKKGKSKGRDFGMEQIKRMKNAGFSLHKRYEEESFAIFRK